ncbi:MAG: GHKL domain-containing protein [Clostridium sp.]
MTLPPDVARTWCENYAVNTIVCYYAEEARKAGIDFSVRLELPKQLSINEAELCSILGNLLENALDACRECTDTAPFIRIRAREEGGHIALAVDNTAAAPPWKKTAVSAQASMKASAPEPLRSAPLRSAIMA